MGSGSSSGCNILTALPRLIVQWAAITTAFNGALMYYDRSGIEYWQDEGYAVWFQMDHDHPDVYMFEDRDAYDHCDFTRAWELSNLGDGETYKHYEYCRTDHGDIATTGYSLYFSTMGAEHDHHACLEGHKAKIDYSIDMRERFIMNWAKQEDKYSEFPGHGMGQPVSEGVLEEEDRRENPSGGEGEWPERSVLETHVTAGSCYQSHHGGPGLHGEEECSVLFFPLNNVFVNDDYFNNMYYHEFEMYEEMDFANCVDHPTKLVQYHDVHEFDAHYDDTYYEHGGHELADETYIDTSYDNTLSLWNTHNDHHGHSVGLKVPDLINGYFYKECHHPGDTLYFRLISDGIRMRDVDHNANDDDNLIYVDTEDFDEDVPTRFEGGGFSVNEGFTPDDADDGQPRTLDIIVHIVDCYPEWIDVESDTLGGDLSGSVEYQTCGMTNFAKPMWVADYYTDEEACCHNLQDWAAEFVPVLSWTTTDVGPGWYFHEAPDAPEMLLVKDEDYCWLNDLGNEGEDEEVWIIKGSTGSPGEVTYEHDGADSPVVLAEADIWCDYDESCCPYHTHLNHHDHHDHHGHHHNDHGHGHVGHHASYHYGHDMHGPPVAGGYHYDHFGGHGYDPMHGDMFYHGDHHGDVHYDDHHDHHHDDGHDGHYYHEGVHGYYDPHHGDPHHGGHGGHHGHYGNQGHF